MSAFTWVLLLEVVAFLLLTPDLYPDRVAAGVGRGVRHRLASAFQRLVRAKRATDRKREEWDLDAPVRVKVRRLLSGVFMTAGMCLLLLIVESGGEALGVVGTLARVVIALATVLSMLLAWNAITGLTWYFTAAALGSFCVRLAKLARLLHADPVRRLGLPAGAALFVAAHVITWYASS